MLSVVLATHNGADTLRRTLDSLLAVAAPDGGWKLIIVDNASTDNTRNIIVDYLTKLPIDYVPEPRLGKAFALNTGLEYAGRELDCDFIVFIDDDVIIPADFLRRWRQVANKCPQFAVFGGRIEPEFAVAPPDWLLETTWPTTLYTRTTVGRPTCEIPMNASDIYGPNMAIRSEIVARGFRYDERLMVGQNDLFADETDFVGRILAEGHRALFVAEIVVRHLVNAEQIKWKWILRRFYRWGRTYYYLLYNRDRPATPSIFGIPYFLYFLFFLKVIRAPVAFASCNQQKIMTFLHDMVFDLGTIRQVRLMLRSDLSWSYRQSEKDPAITRRMQLAAEVIARYIKENQLSTYLDLGSYTGILAAYVQRLCPDVRVICVEAVTETYSYLKQKLPNVAAYNYTIVPEAFPKKISHFDLQQSAPASAGIYNTPETRPSNQAIAAQFEMPRVWINQYRARVGENLTIVELLQRLGLTELDGIYLKTNLEFIDHKIVHDLVIKHKLCPKIVHFEVQAVQNIQLDDEITIELREKVDHSTIDDDYRWIDVPLAGYDYYDYIYVRRDSPSIPSVICYSGENKTDVIPLQAHPRLKAILQSAQTGEPAYAAV